MNAMLFACLVLLSPIAPQDDGVRIAVQPTQTPRGGQVLKLYEVRDLLLDFGKDFEAPQLGVPIVPEAPVAPAASVPVEKRKPWRSEEEEEFEVIEAGAKLLDELIQAHIQPALSDPIEVARCSLTGTLVANLLPVQHEWLAAFLKGLHDFDGYVEVRARFLRAPKGLLAEWKLAPSATLPTEADLAALDERIQASGRFDLLQAPTLVTLPMQRASISTTDAISYVKDWKLEIVEPGKREIADPQIAVIHEGLALEVRAVPLPNGLFGLAVAVQDCSIERPIATRQVRLGSTGDATVEISLPEVHTARFSARVVLASGASAVLSAAGSEPEKDIAVVVTARKVPREPVERR